MPVYICFVLRGKQDKQEWNTSLLKKDYHSIINSISLEYHEWFRKFSCMPNMNKNVEYQNTFKMTLFFLSNVHLDSKVIDET